MARPTSGPLAKGAEAFKSGNYTAAVDAYSEALAQAENAEDRAAVLANRAQCRLRLGDLFEAREDAAAARALAPANPKAWYRLGICEARLGNLCEAEAALQEAAKLRPSDRDVAEALAVVLRRRSEAAGQHAWPELYATGYLAPPAEAADSAAGPAAAREPSGSVLAALGVEPFVGPIRVGFAEGRGRGLFLTQDVSAGQLLMCAQAVVTGENDKLPGLLADCIGRSAELREAVLLLSHGTHLSESSMPLLDAAQLAAPRRLLAEDTCSKPDADEVAKLTEELKTILYFNQFSLPRVNPNAAPIEVVNDFERSGLWLLPSFVNHSCWPNVQRVIVRDCLFLRAGRDLREGDELLDCYAEALQPLAKRATALAGYGFGACNCVRCCLEAAALDAEEVQSVVEQAGKSKDDPNDDNAAIAAKAEAAALRAEAVVAQSLERSLTEARLPRLPGLPLPEAPLKAERMALLREGIERFADRLEEETFRRQERLHRLLLSSLANVVRSHAMSLRGLQRYVDQSAAWSRVLDVLDEVIPCSELAANVSTEVLSAKLLAFHLDFSKACRPEFCRTLFQTHRAYGGGATVWRVLNKHGFAATVLDGSDEVWAQLKKEHNFPEDSYIPVALPEPAARPQVGFEDLLKRRAREERKAEEAPQKLNTGSSGPHKAPGEKSGPSGSAKTHACDDGNQTRPDSCNDRGPDVVGAGPGSVGDRNAAEKVKAPLTMDGGTREFTVLPNAKLPASGRPADSQSVSTGGFVTAADATLGSAERCNPTASYRVIASGAEELTVVADLPGLTSGVDASLEVSEFELRLRSMRSDHPHAVDVPLPRPVDPASSIAKWSKRTQQLTIRLKTVGSESPCSLGEG